MNLSGASPSRSHLGAFAPPLCDQYGRRLDYLRLSVTDLCDLRCRYCMPAAGVELADRREVLTWEEQVRLCRLLGDLGVRKLRLTGGEPLARRGLIPFLARLRELPQPSRLFLTTNGTRLSEFLPDLQRLGISRLNISLDSLRPGTYRRIARRDAFEQVWNGLLQAEAMGFSLKLNMVVLGGVNDEEISAFAELTCGHDWTVRFIEAMPFDGQGGDPTTRIDGDEIRRRLAREFNLVPVVGNRADVAREFRVPGFRGKIGLIFAHSRRFCGDCSRLRISALGQLRTCLYGEPVLDLRQLLRSGATDEAVAEAVRRVVGRRPPTGWAAESASTSACPGSMSEIGG